MVAFLLTQTNHMTVITMAAVTRATKMRVMKKVNAMASPFRRPGMEKNNVKIIIIPKFVQSQLSTVLYIMYTHRRKLSNGGGNTISYYTHPPHTTHPSHTPTHTTHTHTWLSRVHKIRHKLSLYGGELLIQRGRVTCRSIG